MIKKIFTKRQLSLFFQSALLLNIFSLFFNIIIYHFFSGYQLLDLLSENLNNLSMFMISITIISQSLIIFINKYQKFVERYKLLAITLAVIICTFFLWLLIIENDTQEKIVIFFSTLSASNHNYRLLITLLAISIMLIINFYRTLTHPSEVDYKSIPDMIRSTFRLVARRHLVMFIFIIGVIQFKTLNKFAQALLQHIKLSLFIDVNLLGIIIPIIWISAFIYYIYMQFRHRK